ncbi:MAG: HEPN domain-containing protein [Candidatus Micrarchaeota archaeon]|nr:HEPN domain-containing protein [Candidatus Micrarchaeota archaeon]
MKLDELIKKQLISVQSRDPAKIKGSILIAKHFLKRAKSNQEMGFSDVSMLLAYTSMFHSARALPFEKGYKERSHLAMIEALRELYKDNKELQDWLNVLDSYRLTRHSIQYSTELSGELDAAQAIKDAESLISFVVSLIKIDGK